MRTNGSEINYSGIIGYFAGMTQEIRRELAGKALISSEVGQPKSYNVGTFPDITGDLGPSLC